MSLKHLLFSLRYTDYRIRLFCMLVCLWNFIPFCFNATLASLYACVYLCWRYGLMKIQALSPLRRNIKWTGNKKHHILMAHQLYHQESSIVYRKTLVFRYLFAFFGCFRFSRKEWKKKPKHSNSFRSHMKSITTCVTFIMAMLLVWVPKNTQTHMKKER